MEKGYSISIGKNTRKLENNMLLPRSITCICLMVVATIAQRAPHKHTPRNPLHAHMHHGTGYHPTGQRVAGNIHGHCVFHFLFFSLISRLPPLCITISFSFSFSFSSSLLLIFFSSSLLSLSLSLSLSLTHTHTHTQHTTITATIRTTSVNANVPLRLPFMVI